jgi:hypothetical protein
MAQQPTSSALRALALEYKSLQEEPVEGFRVKLVNEDTLFEWEVAIFGPPDTLYQGGYFKVSYSKLKKALSNRCQKVSNFRNNLEQWFSSVATEIFYAFIFKCQIVPLRMFKTC